VRPKVTKVTLLGVEAAKFSKFSLLSYIAAKLTKLTLVSYAVRVAKHEPNR
jgi:hypothetical protein